MPMHRLVQHIPGHQASSGNAMASLGDPWWLKSEILHLFLKSKPVVLLNAGASALTIKILLKFKCSATCWMC